MNTHPESLALSYGARVKMLTLGVFGVPTIVSSLSAFVILVPEDKIALAVIIAIATAIFAGMAAVWTHRKMINSFSCPACGCATVPISESGEAAILWKCSRCERSWSSGLARPIFPDGL
jgi:hypothetical protein